MNISIGYQGNTGLSDIGCHPGRLEHCLVQRSKIQVTGSPKAFRACVYVCMFVCVCVCVCSPHTPSGWTQRNKTATQSAHGRTVPFLFYNLERTFCSSRGCNQVHQQHLHNSLQDTVIVFTRGDISDDGRHPFVQMWYVCVCSACGGCCCLGDLDIKRISCAGKSPGWLDRGALVRTPSSCSMLAQDRIFPETGRDVAPDAQAVRPQHSTPIPSKSMDLN
jgi:hypothetical protein